MKLFNFHSDVVLVRLLLVDYAYIKVTDKDNPWKASRRKINFEKKKKKKKKNVVPKKKVIQNPLKVFSRQQHVPCTTQTQKKMTKPRFETEHILDVICTAELELDLPRVTCGATTP